MFEDTGFASYMYFPSIPVHKAFVSTSSPNMSKSISSNDCFCSKSQSSAITVQYCFSDANAFLMDNTSGESGLRYY